MVFIKRDEASGCKFKSYSLRSASRAQKTAVVAVVAIDGDQLGQLAIERSAVIQEPDFVAVVGVDSQNHRARLAVNLEEAATAIVDDDVANGWRLHVVERAEAVDGGTGAPGAWHRSVATEIG